MPPRGRSPADSLIVRHGPIYDHFAHRWCLKAQLPNGAPATTIFDLAPDLRTALIHPAAIPTYSVALVARDTHHLADVCRRSGQSATFTNPGATLTASHTPDGITMTSTAHHQQLTLAYRHHTAAALAIVTAELRDMLPAHHKAAS
ncbi:hypothetical protein [Actinokineospora cianjurensis]|uniref:Uncharacterized protein n=1 Tax=Actinokineospora cianjurensis TaxID=585224 RepID=A0A421B869_9PSEU|nr:hypothetical protein [Actinokineospora cianjurensis]RLK60410.1 hypothetical protein CLV68_0914 [Actinokineospora cianjurensis]